MRMICCLFQSKSLSRDQSCEDDANWDGINLSQTSQSYGLSQTAPRAPLKRCHYYLTDDNKELLLFKILVDECIVLSNEYSSLIMVEGKAWWCDLNTGAIFNCFSLIQWNLPTSSSVRVSKKEALLAEEWLFWEKVSPDSNWLLKIIRSRENAGSRQSHVQFKSSHAWIWRAATLNSVQHFRKFSGLKLDSDLWVKQETDAAGL